MLRVGEYNRLKIARINATGAFLLTEEGDLLLPGKFIPVGAEPGMELDVFVYCDSEDRLVATTQTPKAVVGEFVLLRVKELHAENGAFLDWGLDKDLLLPFAEQSSPLQPGDQVLVRLYPDQSGRIAASGRLNKFLHPADGALRVGDEIQLLAYAVTDLGVKVVINSRYDGLLFRSELFHTPTRGRRLKGYVRKIRSDGKIDVTLRKGGGEENAMDREVILAALRSRAGFLPLTDKSAPEEISALLSLSKKSFKKAVGGLYKDGQVRMTAEGIRLRLQEA
jgi:uncharacterized protein